MTRRIVPLALAVIVAPAGCGVGVMSEPNAPAPLSEVPSLRELVAARHPNESPWKFAAADTAGQGACAGETLGALLDKIRSGFSDVSDIDRFLPPSPVGPVMATASATRAGQMPPPPTGRSSYIIGLVDDSSFGAVFFRGDRCNGDMCQDRQHWYFESDEQCRPRWVGYQRTLERPGGRYGTCFDVTGSSVWRYPGDPPARRRCDADWSAQNISGTHAAFSLAAPSAVSGYGAGGCGSGEAIIPVEVTITQPEDLAKASVVVRGTGISFLDGRSFTGNVERQSIEAVVEESVNGACPARRRFRVSLDFEEPVHAIPGGFGLLDVNVEAVGACAGPKPDCGASLHLVHRN